MGRKQDLFHALYLFRAGFLTVAYLGVATQQTFVGLEDVLKTCLEDVLKTCLEDVLKTLWRQAKSKCVSNKSIFNKSTFDSSKANPKCIK